MALQDYLQKLFGSSTRLPSPQGTQIGGRIAYPNKAGYTANVELGFKRNPVVAACVGLYASTLNEAPLGVQRSDGSIDTNHPLSLLFRRPNSHMGQSDFWQIVWTYLAISGNCYVKKVRSDYGNIVELIPYSDAYVVPVLDELGWVYAYEYQSNNFKQTWKRDDVIHLHNPAYRDPLRMHMGISPIEVAWDKINTYNELQATMYSLVASNAVPSGILTAPTDIPIATVTSLKEQLKKRKNATGRERTDPLVLGSGMRYEQMGLDASKLQANEMLQELEVAICGAFRIHPVVALTSAGLARSTYNNIQSAYQEYTTLTRVPFWNAIEEQIEAGLTKEYPAIQVQFDLTEVQALQPDADALIYPVVAEFTSNIITQNETRKKLGFEPVEGGDVFAWQVVPQPSFGALSGEDPEVKQADDDMIMQVKDGVVVWNEDFAVKEYNAQTVVVDEYVKPTIKDVQDFIADFVKESRNEVKSAYKAEDPKKKMEKLVKKFMTANADKQARLFTKILDLTMKTTNTDLADVRTYLDDVAEEQAQEVIKNMTESVKTLQKNFDEYVKKNPDLSSDQLWSAIKVEFTKISQVRSPLIAQTIATAQTTKVQNTVVDRMNRQIPNARDKFVNVWLSQRDSDVRPTHQLLDGKWVDMGASFGIFVDGIGEGPGIGSDPSETIRCRCVCRPVRKSRVQQQQQ